MRDLDRKEMLSLLKQETVGHLALSEDGEPYVTPISFAHSKDTIYFRTGPGRRLSALRAHPRVCIEVSRYSNEMGDWESVLVWGNAAVVEDQAEEDESIALLLLKYRNVFTATAAFTELTPLREDEVVVKVPVETMTGRSSQAGFTPELRPGRL